MRAGWSRDHGLACRLPGQSPPEMGVEGGGEGEEEEEQGLPGQQEQHGTPGGVIDRLVGHMTVPRLPVLVEAGSTTNTTTAANNNNDNTANTIDIMHIRLLHRRQEGSSQHCLLCRASVKAWSGHGKALDGRGAGGWLEALGRPRRGVEVAAGSSVDLSHPPESPCEPQGASSTSLNQERQARRQEHRDGLLLLRARQSGKATLANPPLPQDAIIGFAMLDTTNTNINANAGKIAVASLFYGH